MNATTQGKTIFPLLKISTFGTHLLDNPAGTFSFVGSVPAELTKARYATYAEGFAAFVTWYKAQDVEFQRDNISNLRNDVFEAVLGGTVKINAN